MTDELNILLNPWQLDMLLGSWLAWSASNMVFSPKGELLLGQRSETAVMSIPEPGDYCLIGGFNTEDVGPAMLADVADMHMHAQLGLLVEPKQCSGFLPCEYPMDEIIVPLETVSLGKMGLKRMAFNRMVLLTARQVETLQPQGKLKRVEWVTRDRFEYLAESGRLSFPYQVAHVREGFAWMKTALAAQDMTMPKIIGWHLV